MFEIAIHYFGMLTDKTGKSTEKISIDTQLTIEALNQLLIEKHQGLKSTKYKIALNNQFVDHQELITANAEISLLPPFSGG